MGVLTRPWVSGGNFQWIRELVRGLKPAESKSDVHCVYRAYHQCALMGLWSLQ